MMMILMMIIVVALLHTIAGEQIKSDIAAAYNSTSEDFKCRTGERVMVLLSTVFYGITVS